MKGLYKVTGHRTLISLFFVSLMVAGLPSLVAAAEPGSVLVLNSENSAAGLVVSGYGAGFVVKIDEASNTAFTLTALHVIKGAGNIHILYDPTFFPQDYLYDLKEGIIPGAIAGSLAGQGHPIPTGIRNGLAPTGGQPVVPGRLYFPTESWVLSGDNREYLVIPQGDHLELYHLLPATVVQQSDAALDVALLSIEKFPDFEVSPVLYMASSDSVSIGTTIVTSGCNCGLDEGISQADVQGSVLSSDPGFLTYESSQVNPGFSGGPVIAGGFVVAMNLTEDLKTGSKIQSRLASSFKDLVDGWIGLQRMSVTIFIESPAGAANGVVSTGQEFVIKARALPDPEGQVLAPIVAIDLRLPPQYQAQEALHGVLHLGEEKTWTITSPPTKSSSQPITLFDGNNNPVATITATTEAGTLLQGAWVECPKDGGCLFLDDVFDLAIQFQRSNTSDGGGKVALQANRHQFELVRGNPTISFNADEIIRWKLRTKDLSVGAPISFKSPIETFDRNGKPISIELPPPVRFSIKQDFKTQIYFGFGRFDLEEPSTKTKPELELGLKFRIANIMQRGIPLRLAFFGGFGVDDAWNKDFETVSDGSMIADLRYWGGAGFSTALGPVEACFDVGYLVLSRYVDSNVPDELRPRYELDGVKSLFLRPGIELALAPHIAFYGGARFISDLEDTEYYLQIRLRKGK